MTIAETLGGFVANLSIADLPSEVVDKAKACLFWGLCGSFVADGSLGKNKVNRHIAAKVASATRFDSGPASTVFLGGARTSAADAMFANSVLFANTMSDSYLAAARFGPSILPVALAAAEQKGESGASLIVAIVAGYEIATAFAKDHLTPTIENGWRAALVFGGLGATAVAGRLLRLDEQKASNALSLSASLSCGTMEPVRTRGTEVNLMTGVVGRNGYMNALLAEQGAVGVSSAFEGEAGFLMHFPGTRDYMDGITSNLGREFEIMNVTFKRFKTSGRATTPILLAIQLAQEEDVDPSQIERVEVELNRFEEGYPPNRTTGDARMIDGIAGALAHRVGDGEAGVLHDDPKYQRVWERILTRPVDDLGPYCARLTVWTKEARYQRETVDGMRLHTFTFDETVKLAQDRLATMSIDETTLDRVASIVGELERVSDMSELIHQSTQKG